MSIAQRIEHAFLEGERAVRFSVLAERLYPDKQSWRYSANGGPPGCYISLASALRRHKIKDYRDQHGVRYVVKPTR